MLKYGYFYDFPWIFTFRLKCCIFFKKVRPFTFFKFSKKTQKLFFRFSIYFSFSEWNVSSTSKVQAFSFHLSEMMRRVFFMIFYTFSFLWVKYGFKLKSSIQIFLYQYSWNLIFKWIFFWNFQLWKLFPFIIDTNIYVSARFCASKKNKTKRNFHFCEG